MAAQTQTLPGLGGAESDKREWFVKVHPMGEKAGWELTDGEWSDPDDWRAKMMDGRIRFCSVHPTEAKARYWCEQLNEIENTLSGKARVNARRKMLDSKAFEKDTGFKT